MQQKERDILIEFIRAHLHLFTQDELDYFVDYIVTKNIDFRKKTEIN
tara:strand:- start:122 stop:262 length:141 start_codon:yes stop_codon:yes gene_type:complete